MRTNKNRLNPTYQSSDIHMDTTHQSSFSEKSGVLPCWSCHYFDYLWNYFFGIAFKNPKKKMFLLCVQEEFSLSPFLIYIFFPNPQFAKFSTGSSQSHFRFSPQPEGTSESSFACGGLELKAPRESDWVADLKPW